MFTGKMFKKLLPSCFRLISRQQSAVASSIPATKSSKINHFNWEDPLDLDSCLDEDEKMIRDHFHDYCQEKLMPRVKVSYICF